MRPPAKKRSQKTGLPPGTLVHIGEQHAERAQIRVMRYAGGPAEEFTVATADELVAMRGSGVIWAHVVGVHDVELLGRLGVLFGLHPLVREDIANTDQRAKLEDYADYLYVVLKMLRDGESTANTRAEQCSIVLGRDFVLSFEEALPSIFEPVRNRLRQSAGQVDQLAADFIAYSLLDAIVDDYFQVLERFGERIESLQDQLLEGEARGADVALRDLRHEMVLLRRNIWPLREVIGTLRHGHVNLFRPETGVYLRDVYDHIVHMIETLEAFHETLTYTLDIYQLNATNELNQIIKVLTVIATLAIPPTLVASIYGMNFKDMPELSWTFGYPYALGLMGAAVAGMLFFFRRKKWF